MAQAPRPNSRVLEREDAQDILADYKDRTKTVLSIQKTRIIGMQELMILVDKSGVPRRLKDYEEMRVPKIKPRFGRKLLTMKVPLVVGETFTDEHGHPGIVLASARIGNSYENQIHFTGKPPLRLERASAAAGC